jgi:membrane-associated phospholipid phosphatase
VGQVESAPSAKPSTRVGLTLGVCALVVGVASWVPVRGRQVTGWEQAVFHALNNLPGFLFGPVWLVMQLGTWFAIGGVALAALVLRQTRLALAFALAGATASLLSNVLKALIGRGRPAALLAEVHTRGAVPTGNGFPSGHASVAFAVATVAWLWLDGWVRWVLPCAAVIVGFARIYVGAHFPLDVVGGAALGTACGAAVSLALRPRPSAAG